MLQTAFIFYGRERRQVFWSATLTNLGFTIICILIFGSIKTISWIGYIYVLLTIVPQISMTVRRLHDVNASGKQLFWLLVPVLGWTFLIVQLTFDSTPETNIYGESLKYPKDNKVILSPDAIAKPKKPTETNQKLEETNQELEETQQETINNEEILKEVEKNQLN